MSLYDSLALEGARMLSFEMSHNFGICSIQRTIQVFKKASGLKKNKYSSVLYAGSGQIHQVWNYITAFLPSDS